MKAVIDTNVLVMSLPPRSVYHPIIRNFLDNFYDIYFTNEMLLENEEIFFVKSNPYVAEAFLAILKNKPNAHRIFRYFRMDLVPNDADDNKFSDCALPARADYLVSNDGDFKHLRSDDWLPFQVVKPDEFLEILKENFG